MSPLNSELDNDLFPGTGSPKALGDALALNDSSGIALFAVIAILCASYLVRGYRTLKRRFV